MVRGSVVPFREIPDSSVKVPETPWVRGKHGRESMFGHQIVTAKVGQRNSLGLNLEFQKAAFFIAALGAHANSCAKVSVPITCRRQLLYI